MEMISFKEYSKRKDVFYKMSDRRERSGEKTMIRCSCSNKFTMKNREPICSSCGTIINTELALNLNVEGYSLYNSSTCMFVDLNKEKETIATISMILLTVTRFPGDFYPNIGENAVRLKIRFNITKRTGLMYMTRFRVKSDLDWENIKTKSRYINFTQPAKEYLPYTTDIKLPRELVEDLLELMKLKKEDIGKDLSEINIYELAWLNRIRDFKEATRYQTILQILTKQQERHDREAYKEDFLYYRKNLNRVKRHISSGYKPKNYDENIFNSLCVSYGIDRKYIPKSLEKYYYMNPMAIKHAEYHDLLFKNKDIRVNAIMSIDKNHSDNIYMSKDPTIKETIIDVFKNETNIYQKTKNNSDYYYLHDTARIIKEVRDSGIKVKTKGNLYELHDKFSKKLKYIKVPDVTFENTKDLEDIICGDYTFIYAKTPRELISIGEISNTCVGSYYQDCISGNTEIVYIKQENELIGILELSKNHHKEKKTICQAKGHSNSLLTAKIQKAISSFCLAQDYLIRTSDINKILQSKHNEKIVPVRDIDEEETYVGVEFARNPFAEIMNDAMPF